MDGRAECVSPLSDVYSVLGSQGLYKCQYKRAQHVHLLMCRQFLSADIGTCGGGGDTSAVQKYSSTPQTLRYK